MTDKATAAARIATPFIVAAALIATGCDTAKPPSGNTHGARDAGTTHEDAGATHESDAGAHTGSHDMSGGAGTAADGASTGAAGGDGPEPCDKPVCGDGQATECPYRNQKEICDGDDLAGVRCTDLGFAGGTLACSQTCALDTSHCGPCEDDARIAQCTASETLPGVGYGFGLAWRDGVLLVATAIGDQDALAEGARHPVQLIALDAELQALGKPRTLEAEEPWIAGLAPVSDGFLIAYVDGWPGRGGPLYTQHLDASGAPDAERIFHPGVGLGAVIARPDGGPLLVVNSTPTHVTEFPDGGLPPSNPPRAGGSVYAILLDEQGEEVWSQPTDGDVIQELNNGAYTGDGFVFATEATPSHAHSVRRVELDGTVSPPAWQVPPVGAESSSLYYPQLGWDGSAVWMTWSDGSADAETCMKPRPNLDGGGTFGGECTLTPSELRWAKLDRSGAPLDGPNALSGVVRSPARWIANGDDRVLVSGAPTSSVGESSGLVLRRFDDAMQPKGEAVTIAPVTSADVIGAEGNPGSARQFDAVFGPEGTVFVAWTSFSYLHHYAMLRVAKIVQ